MQPTTEPADQPAGADLLQLTAERVQALLDASVAEGPMARERGEQLVRLIVDLYGAGLARLLDLAYDNGNLDDQLLAALADDELVSGLLMVHGLHPLDLETRVARALDGVRPYLHSHGGDVELVEITEAGVVRLKLTGSCDGCPSSAVTLELAVQGAVRDAAPEVSEIELVAAPTPATVIGIAELRSRIAAPVAAAGWQPLPEPDTLHTGRAEPRLVAGQQIVVCAVGSELFAFIDRCGGCAGSLAGSGLHRRLGSDSAAAVLRCPGCGRHFDVPGAGAGVEDPTVRLTPLPLLIGQDGPTVAVPVVA